MDYLVDELPPEQRLVNLANMVLIVRAQGDPSALAGSLRGAVHDIDPTVPFNTPKTLTEVLSTTLVFERMQSWLFGIFAGFALLLSLIGIYGMVKHEVELRTREIGVRMALGSTRGRVLTHILRRVSVLMLVGLTAGWIITGLTHKILAALVQLRIEENLAMLIAVTVGLGAIGVAASVLPARKAASIDPITALRID
jgi:ABC-type antimicrobial peptide transport system permease subunit